MDRQVLSSVRATENNSKYAAALLANGKLFSGILSNFDEKY